MSPGRMRRLWVQIHLWLGLTLGSLGVLLGLSGSLLVFDHAIDARLNPQRYAVSGGGMPLPLADYLDRAAEALGANVRATTLRTPGSEGAPVQVFARARAGGATQRVYLDPPTARVLDVSAGGGLVGWAHDLHGSLMLRAYSGREIVGVAGIAMLVSALSGVYLWWPRGTPWRAALGRRRGFTLARNLHFLGGFYGSLVLAMLAFTGALIAFPDAARATLSLFGPVAAPARDVQARESAGEQKHISPDAALARVRALVPQARLAALSLPNGPRGSYRIALSSPSGSVVAFIDPASGDLLRRIDAAGRNAGERFLALQRPLHEGSALGLPGRVVVCIAGLLPALLALSGWNMWLRRRRRTATPAAPSEATPA